MGSLSHLLYKSFGQQAGGDLVDSGKLTIVYLSRYRQKFETFLFLVRRQRSAAHHLSMWFQLILNASVPPVQVMIGVEGNMYFRLSDLVQLLQIKNALTHGYAHQRVMRKVTDKFKKGPTLTVVDTRDAKSVFIPEWIRHFKLDVKKVRREEVKSQTPIQVKALISNYYPNECFFYSIAPMIETTFDETTPR
ncbi:hypothetical protein TNIN_350031 [Trichonephila inaurata madagascariensis]|uniref:Uncharacterized protein n=1 Tax=Trichonephila inaurata madagascariensis TaxID=2747483 RepID=A0A8X6INC1_9ARAC|nr:hypothetical protein TNIN_350031 [Trichonephila inaurata madagascariensis]